MREPAEPWRAAENVGEKPMIEQSLDRGTRLRRDQDALELGAYPLGRELSQAAPLLHASGEACRVERALAVISVEPEEAEDAQIVLGDARFRVADEPHAPGHEVGIAAERVVERTLRVRIERI